MFSPYCYYKIANFLYRKNVPFIPRIITLLIRMIFTCYLPHRAQIDGPLVLGYGGMSVVIHDRVVIGKNCHIDQCVTIGGTSKKIDVPVLGDNVYVGAGAKIIGPVSIGNNVVIGANAVVLCDLPDNCVAVGVPAKVIKHGIEKSDYV